VVVLVRSVWRGSTAVLYHPGGAQEWAPDSGDGQG
jgi:hypothetical protein